MSRMIFVKKYSYQITNANFYYANLCIDNSGKYLQLQNMDVIEKGLGIMEAITEKSK